MKKAALNEKNGHSPDCGHPHRATTYRVCIADRMVDFAAETDRRAARSGDQR